MNNRELDLKFGQLIKTERKITREILEMIVLAEHQRLPQELAFKDTYDWLIRGHGYSSGAANRRIQAARLLKIVPEAAEQVENGSLNLTTLCQTQRMIRSQQNATGQMVTPDQKREALEKIAGKTSEEAERELLEFFPQAETFVEKIVQTRDGGIGLSVHFTAEEALELKRAQELLSHAMPGASMAQIIVRLAQEHNERKDPLRQEEATTQSDLGATPRRGTKRRVVMQKAKGGCEYIDPITKRVCGSRYQLEIDHIVPRAKGGSDDPSNLRCLCRKHNQWMAEQELGREFMDSCRGA